MRRSATAARGILAKQIAVRLSETDLKRLEAIVKQVPIAKRNAIARAALRLGLDVLEKDPTKIVEQRSARHRPRPVRRRTA